MNILTYLEVLPAYYLRELNIHRIKQIFQKIILIQVYILRNNFKKYLYLLFLSIYRLKILIIS